MSFEVRAVRPSEEGPAPEIWRFTDEEWRNLTALAHECGFDAGRQHEELVYPGVGDTGELDARLAQQLYIGVSAVRNQDVLPFATTREADDGNVHFRWVKPPGYGEELLPDDRTAGGSDFRIERAALDRLVEHLARGPIRVTRVEDPDG